MLTRLIIYFAKYYGGNGGEWLLGKNVKLRVWGEKIKKKEKEEEKLKTA